jgi:gliding motility-associated-like protein
MPEGVNNVFKPITIYVEADSYIFQVYNRWGQRVFETNDPNQGWDGTGGGKEHPQGAYVYFLSFVSSDGQTFTKNGSITLIR